MSPAVFIPDRAERQGFCLFQKRKTGGEVAGFLGGGQLYGRFQKREKKGFDSPTCADDPSGNAVDAGVEEIQPDMGAAKEIAAHEFLHDGACGIVEKHDVVAVPTHAPAYMKKEARHKLQDG